MERIYTAIIPVYNSEQTIIKSINSLIRLKHPPKKIIVIDDASTDRTTYLVKQINGVNLKSLKKNVGPAMARNIGAKESQTKWLLFIDSDCILPRNSILNAFPSKEEEENKIVGKMGVFDIKDENKSLIAKYKNMQRHFEIKAMKNPPEVFTSSCFTIRKDAFSKISGFNENYGKIPTEDNEFYFRLISKNLFIKYDINFSFHHLKKMSIQKLFYDDFYRAKAIIQNIFGQLGHRRNSINKIEIIKWIIELSSAYLITKVIILIPIILLFFPLFYFNISLLIFIFSTINLILVNHKFYRFSLEYGGIRMLINHVLLRIFEMITAIIGILLGIFELLFKVSNNFKNNLEK